MGFQLGKSVCSTWSLNILVCRVAPERLKALVQASKIVEKLSYLRGIAGADHRIFRMGAVTIRQMTERVTELMRRRLRIKGNNLGEAIAKSRRLLPRKIRTAAEALVLAEIWSHNPKLLLRVDETAVAKNYDICVRYLSHLNRRERVKGVVLNLASGILFSLICVVALVIGVLVWRGFL